MSREVASATLEIDGAPVGHFSTLRYETTIDAPSVGESLAMVILEEARRLHNHHLHISSGVRCTVASLESLGVRVVERPGGRVRCYLPRAHRSEFQAIKAELAAMCPVHIHMTLLLERG